MSRNWFDWVRLGWTDPYRGRYLWERAAPCGAAPSRHRSGIGLARFDLDRLLECGDTSPLSQEVPQLRDRHDQSADLSAPSERRLPKTGKVALFPINWFDWV
jgi:hypothetical protein